MGACSNMIEPCNAQYHLSIYPCDTFGVKFWITCDVSIENGTGPYAGDVVSAASPPPPTRVKRSISYLKLNLCVTYMLK